VPGYFAMRQPPSPAAFVGDSIFSPPLLPKDADEAVNGVLLPARSDHDLGQSHVLGARFIIAITVDITGTGRRMVCVPGGMYAGISS
jgi:hypothetical protein